MRGGGEGGLKDGKWESPDCCACRVYIPIGWHNSTEIKKVLLLHSVLQIEEVETKHIFKHF